MIQNIPLIKGFIHDLKLFLRQQVVSWKNYKNLNNYLKSDRRPWREGFHQYRAKYIEDVINDHALLENFRFNKPLPEGFGYRIDARVVEVPWALSKLSEHSGRLLDAGSSFNTNYTLNSPSLSNYKITIATLAPEGICLWNLGISYVFSDLRILDFRDNWFDTVVCISTIEHVGMDNSLYAGSAEVAKRANPKDFLLAVRELKRVLKPDGTLYITFPFGQYEDHGWFQQFDSALADTLIEEFNPIFFEETVYKYDPDGWKLSNRSFCSKCQFFDVHTSKYFNSKSTIEYPTDYPAGERAVICLALIK
jgi:SAM-dependent methyltransferase